MSRPNYDPDGRGQYEALTGANTIRRRWHRNKLRLHDLARLSPTDRVLDAGCGSGNLVCELVPYCGQVIGCDIHHARLVFAAARDAGSYVQSDLQQLPFADNLFNTIFCMEVLEHLEQRVIIHALREFYRTLKPQGQLLITTPNYHSPWVVIEFLADTLQFSPEMVGGEHISKYHRRTLAEALRREGFLITRLGSFNHLSPFISLISERWAERLYQWELKVSPPAGNLLYALAKKP